MFTLFWLFPFYGQNQVDLTDHLQEHIVLHIDRDLYLSGETIWFSAFCYADESLTMPSVSRVLYLELYSYESKSLYKLKIELNNGKTSGAIMIPEETLSGNYFLSAYTQSQRNFPSRLFHTSVITIIHPEKPLPGIKADTGSSDSDLMGLKNTDIAGIMPVLVNPGNNKNAYLQREQINLSLKVPELKNDEFANVSVAVIKQGTGSGYHQLNNKYNGEMKFTVEDLNFVPEVRDISISGIVREKESQKPLSGIQVFISVLGENPQFHIYKTNPRGEFLFSLNQVSGELDVCLCTEKTGEPDLEILINKDFVSSYPDVPDIPLNIDTSRQQLLEDMFINYQLSKQFLKKDSLPDYTPQLSPFIFGETYMTIVLDDYIPLPDLETVMKELVPPVKIKKRKGDYFLSVYHADRGLMFENPLVLVDNIVIFDINELMKIHPSLIEKIEVIKETHQYGDYVLRGIVSITTITDNFGGMKLPSGYIFAEFQTLNESADFVFPEFNTDLKKESPVPDFRNLLFWNPDLKLDGEGTQISFYSGDHCADYDIIVRGVTNTGKICFGKTSVSVKH